MSIKRHQIKVPMILTLFLLILSVGAASVDVPAVESRKLDETPAAPPTNGNQKCTPCGNSYPPPPYVYSSPPPPPYVYSPPPPPPYEYSSPPPPPYEYSSPPPPKKTPSSKYCPPPPPASFLYITGPPGNLYPVDENFNSAPSRRSFPATLPLLLVASFSLLRLL